MVDLSKYSTYAYLPNADVEMEGMSMDKDQVNQQIINSLNEEMMDQGYRLDRDNPDLLVLLSVKKDSETAVDVDAEYATYPYSTYGVSTVSPYYGNYYYNDFYGYSNLVGYDVDTYQYKEGSLVVSLVDRKTKNVVWKAATEDDIYQSDTTEEIAELVDHAFDEYPVTK